MDPKFIEFITELILTTIKLESTTMFIKFIFALLFYDFIFKPFILFIIDKVEHLLKIRRKNK